MIIILQRCSDVDEHYLSRLDRSFTLFLERDREQSNEILNSVSCANDFNLSGDQYDWCSIGKRAFRSCNVVFSRCSLEQRFQFAVSSLHRQVNVEEQKEGVKVVIMIQTMICFTYTHEYVFTLSHHYHHSDQFALVKEKRCVSVLVYTYKYTRITD